MNIIEAAEQMQQGFTVKSVSGNCTLRYDPNFLASAGANGVGRIRYVRKYLLSGYEETYPWKPAPSHLLATDYEVVT